MDAFLVGFKSEEYWPSARECGAYLHKAVNVYNETMTEWNNTIDEETGKKVTPT